MKQIIDFSMLLVSCSLLICNFAASAQVSVEWDKTLGGNGEDFLQDIITTPDGGYLLAGTSYSNTSGDKSGDSQGYWIVKIDEQGNKLWDKTLGGSKEDQLSSVITTSDGGYLLAGSSSSNASGDKSEDSRGLEDYWVIKIDENGNKQWDKTLGGDDTDILTDVASTPDGGYLLAGRSGSPASGDKSEGNRGFFDDFWVIKIDQNGNKEWDKVYGGDDFDSPSRVIATADGGYLIAGTSESDASGDKSEDTNYIDYWVIKIDENGNKIWDKTYGGIVLDVLTDATSTPDGGYLLAGRSGSPASGDKTEDNIGGCDGEGRCGIDYWVIKIDENGNKQWDKTLGGDRFDFLTSVVATPDRGYLLAGYSFSDASVDKSEDNWEFDVPDYWLIKIDEYGNKQWDKTLGSVDYDFLTTAITTPDGGYLLAGRSGSPASGDKTEDSKGESDYWIIKVVVVEEEDFSIKGISLINAESDEELQEINDGDAIDLATLPSHQLSIEAITEPAVVGSVAFRIEGPFIHGHTENNAPYAIFGDKPAGDFSGRILPPGEYTLTATPYAEKNKAGAAGTALEINFTIINSDEIEDSQVTAFDLYDAVTDEKLMELTEGTVIHTDELAHEALTVLMHTVPDFVGSVKVELWGPLSLTRIENTKPYALFRNNSKNFFGEVLPAGKYTLRATPYPQTNAQGVAGEPLEVHFTVVDGDASSARLAAYPVPTSGVVNISYQGSAEQADLMLLDFTGQPLLTMSMQEKTQLDLSSYRKGIYYIKVVDNEGVHLKRVVVE